jgi:segregation and condensation protein B
MNKDQLKSVIEAMIFASDSPLTIHQMVSVLENFEKTEIEEVIGQINVELEGRAFTLKKVSGGYQFATRPDYSRWIKKMYQGKERNRLTRAALETLAIIAFKQPISRVEVSAIRGVNSDGVIKGLLERKLITISGRGEGQGRALLFNTTPEFLQYFSINELADLPKPKEIEELLAAGEGARIMSELEEAGMVKQDAGDVEGSDLSESTLSEEDLLAAGENLESIDIAISTEETAITPEPATKEMSILEELVVESEPPLEEATFEEVMASVPSISEQHLEVEMISDDNFPAERSDDSEQVDESFITEPSADVDVSARPAEGEEDSTKSEEYRDSN